MLNATESKEIPMEKITLTLNRERIPVQAMVQQLTPQIQTDVLAAKIQVLLLGFSTTGSIVLIIWKSGQEPVSGSLIWFE